MMRARVQKAGYSSSSSTVLAKAWGPLQLPWHSGIRDLGDWISLPNQSGQSWARCPGWPRRVGSRAPWSSTSGILARWVVAGLHSLVLPQAAGQPHLLLEGASTV